MGKTQSGIFFRPLIAALRRRYRSSFASVSPANCRARRRDTQGEYVKEAGGWFKPGAVSAALQAPPSAREQLAPWLVRSAGQAQRTGRRHRAGAADYPIRDRGRAAWDKNTTGPLLKACAFGVTLCRFNLGIPRAHQPFAGSNMPFDNSKQTM